MYSDDDHNEEDFQKYYQAKSELESATHIIEEGMFKTSISNYRAWVIDWGGCLVDANFDETFGQHFSAKNVLEWKGQLQKAIGIMKNGFEQFEANFGSLPRSLILNEGNPDHLSYGELKALLKTDAFKKLYEHNGRNLGKH